MIWTERSHASATSLHYPLGTQALFEGAAFATAAHLRKWIDWWSN